MKIGIANEKKGISYFDLVYKLHGTKNQVFTMEAEQTFCEWFIQNFSCLDDYSNNVGLVPVDFHKFLYENFKGSDYHARGANMHLFDYLNQKWFLNGNAAKQFLDYQEFKAARRNSLIATMFAIVSILIAAVTFWFSYQSDLNSPKPPYEVKIIENSINPNNLEKKNMELKEKLYKAELMIKSLEEKPN